MLLYPILDLGWVYKLTEEELIKLKHLLFYLFANQDLGYTLMGDKPVSFCILTTGIPHIATKDHIFKIYKRGEYSFRKSITIAKKFLKSRHYLFITYEENNLPIFALIVNKKRFLEEFNKNIDVFQKYDNSIITAEDFLKHLINKNIFFNEIIIHQHLLLGIILGYGRHNAELFARREELLSSIPKIPFSLQKKPRAHFSKVEEEIQYLNDHLKPITNKSSLLSIVRILNFVADPYDPSTLLLKKKYASTHKELTRIFKSQNWMDIILAQFQEVQSPQLH